MMAHSADRLSSATCVPSVLLIDAYPDTRQMYAEYLRAAHFHPIELAGTDDALAQAEVADVIVTGIQIPGPFDGIELVRRLRADDRTRPKPIIVLSASALAHERSRAQHAGCDLFLAKPCLPDAFVREIQILLAETSKPKRTVPAPLRSRGDVA